MIGSDSLHFITFHNKEIDSTYCQQDWISQSYNLGSFLIADEMTFLSFFLLSIVERILVLMTMQFINKFLLRKFFDDDENLMAKAFYANRLRLGSNYDSVFFLIALPNVQSGTT